LTGAPTDQLCQIAALRAEQALDDAGPQAAGHAAAMVLQAELVLQRPDDGDVGRDDVSASGGASTTGDRMRVAPGG
jgi:hypothetical protein